MRQGAVYQREEANGEWRVANGEQGEARLARVAVTLTIRHSPFAIRHSPFAIRHSPLPFGQMKLSLTNRQSGRMASGEWRAANGGHHDALADLRCHTPLTTHHFLRYNLKRSSSL